jgi:hypothetical protein
MVGGGVGAGDVQGEGAPGLLFVGVPNEASRYVEGVDVQPARAPADPQGVRAAGKKTTAPRFLLVPRSRD